MLTFPISFGLFGILSLVIAFILKKWKKNKGYIKSAIVSTLFVILFTIIYIILAGIK